MNILLSIISLFAGVSLTFAFAPFAFYPLAVIAPAILLLIWMKSSAKQAFFRGFLFGAGLFGSGTYWIYISIHNYGNASVFLATLITTIFVLYFALFPALHGFLLNKLFPKNTLKKILLVFPLTWVICEWLRGCFELGFPWLEVGYSQIDSPLRGIAPIAGSYAVSLITVLSGAALVGIWHAKNKTQKAMIFAALIFIWTGSFYLGKIKWTKPSGNPVQVSLIQGNILQEQKWQSNQLYPILNKYYALTKQNWASKIIIWPEAAIPTTQLQVENYLLKIDKEAAAHKVTVISGIPLALYENGHKNELRYYNAVIALGANHGKYLKRHLVPFGEFTPSAPLLGTIIKWTDIPMSDFSAGPKSQPPLIAGSAAAPIPIAPFVCYEIAYPRLMLDYLPDAQLLLTVSDDSWFGKSIALAQQLQISRMRSLESGRYQMVNSNTGLTAIIDDLGKITALAPPFVTFVLTGEVQPMTGETPYAYLGSYLKLDHQVFW